MKHLLSTKLLETDVVVNITVFKVGLLKKNSRVITWVYF